MIVHGICVWGIRHPKIQGFTDGTSILGFYQSAWNYAMLFEAKKPRILQCYKTLAGPVDHSIESLIAEGLCNLFIGRTRIPTCQLAIPVCTSSKTQITGYICLNANKNCYRLSE